MHCINLKRLQKSAALSSLNGLLEAAVDLVGHFQAAARDLHVSHFQELTSRVWQTMQDFGLVEERALCSVGAEMHSEMVAAAVKDGMLTHSNPWHINRVNVELEVGTQDKQLFDRNGRFGTAYQGQWRGMDVLVKMADGKAMVGGMSVRQLMAEVMMQACIWHPNVARVYGLCYETGSVPWVLTEPCVISLWSMIHSASALGVEFTKTEGIWMLGQIGLALSFLHGRRPAILHRDVKPQNIMLTSERVPKLVDVGSGRSKTKAARAAATYADAAYDV